MNEDNKSVLRKPILTTSNRRNAKNHPEFLDTETLLERFEPLLKSIHKHFCSYDGIFDQPDDVFDLYNQIVYEFLKLRKNFDPKRGVDFPGYIKFHLQQRVYHYVTKQQKLTSNEQVVRTYGENNEEQPLQLDNSSELIDYETEDNLVKVEAIASIPWYCLTEEQSQLVKDILINHEMVETIAKRDKVTIKSVKQRLDEICDLFVDIYNNNDKVDN